MIPGVNSHLCTKILQTPALAHTEQTDKTLQLHVEEPLQHTHTKKAGIRIAGVFQMHTYNLTNSEIKKQNSPDMYEKLTKYLHVDHLIQINQKIIQNQKQSLNIFFSPLIL